MTQTKSSKTTRPRNRRQKIKAYLRQAAKTENVIKLALPAILLLDFIDDGQVNGSMILQAIS